MKLTQKESMLLQDLKTSEEICIEKYGQYAQKAEDQALADLFLTIRTSRAARASPGTGRPPRSPTARPTSIF